MDPLPLFSDNRYATNKLFFRIHGARCIGEGALVGYEPLRIKFPCVTRGLAFVAVGASFLCKERHALA
jgi:hypothetical protein